MKKKKSNIFCSSIQSAPVSIGKSASDDNTYKKKKKKENAVSKVAYLKIEGAILFQWLQKRNIFSSCCI